MTIELTSEQEAIVLEIARNDGKTPGEVLTETAVWLHDLEADEDERRLLDRRLEEADRGEFLPQSEMEARFQAMLRPR
jgi:predicted transcriptional regulator